MATLSHSETRRLYSWWWDSHIPKNSKWLQENLTDMDGKVKAMIKLIEEDADSFARRAEMYYKKRPELMKLVEEFYRAYRALAERHDHLTGELRHAHRTIAKAFPDQLPFELEDDSPARSSAPEQERQVYDVSELSLAFLSQENRESSSESLQSSYENENVKAMASSENEIQDMKRVIADVQAEKDTIFLQYQICLEKLSSMEADLLRAENDSMRFCEQKVKAESEIETMKQALASLEVEKADALAKQLEFIAQIADLQGIISQAENESQRLTEYISKIESEKDASIQTYKLCLEKISYLEHKISLIEEDAKQFKEKAENAENEVIRLRKCLAELTVEKEYADLQYKNCVKRISDLETELACVQEDVKRLHTEVQMEIMKRENSEKKCSLLEISKQSLTQVADDLARKTAMKDEELSRKHAELENEIVYLKMMKARLEKEVIKQTGQTNSLQKEVSSLSEEINGLNDHYQVLLKKLESVGVSPDTIETSVKNLLDENSRLKDICESESTEKEILSKRLYDVEEVSKKRNVLERSLSQLNGQLESSRGEVREMQKTGQFMLGEKSVLVAEKATLLAQLQALAENMQKALGNNAVLENSLSAAKIELEGLREKSKGLEEICHLLKSEKSDLFIQRETLIVQLANVERRMEHMEHKYAGLEERYTDLEMLNKRLESEIQELTLSLNAVKLERTNSVHRYETLLVNAEQHINLLQAENQQRKKEYEDELDKAARAEFELFILHKFIQDMEAKNGSLLIECRKYVEASKLAEKLISELEKEHLEEEVEAELLIDEIENLRFGICRIFKALEAGSGHGAFQENVPKEQVLVHQIIGSIEEMKRSLSKYKDDKQLLQVENGVLSTLLSQMATDGTEINSKKVLLEEDKQVITEKLMKVQNEKEMLLETNELLKPQLLLLQSDMTNLSTKHCDMEKAYLDLLENHFQLLDENRSLFQDCSDLSAEKCLLESENDDLLHVTLSYSIFSTVLESLVNESSLELSTMDEVLCDLTQTKAELEKDREILQGKLDLKEEDNMFLEDVVQSFELEMLSVKEVLRQKEYKLSESERKLRTEEEINLELANSLDMLRTRFEESSIARETAEHHILEICEDKSMQQKEIDGLQEDNANLVSELYKLRKECEEHRSREENLNAKMAEKDAEFELWEGEAAVFYFDLQVLSVQEVLHENKVHELTEMCGNLRDETVSRVREIQEMKGKLMRMESEIGELKAELSAYAPIIASLMDDVTSLEHSARLHTKLVMLPDDLETKSVGFDINTSFKDNPTDVELTLQSGIQDLRKLQLRINVVEKTMFEEIKKLVVQESPKMEGKQGTVMKKIIDLKPHGGFIHRKVKERKEIGPILNSRVKLFDPKTKSLASRKENSMKDIPLDQILESSSNIYHRRANSTTEKVEDKVLELWETAQHNGLSETISYRKNPSFAATHRKIEHPTTVSEMEIELGIDKLEVSSNLGQSKQEAKTMKILEKLASDARRLTSLQFTVEDLNRKLDANTKLRRKAKNVDLDTIKEQLEEVQETVYELVELNGKLIGNVVESPSSPQDETSLHERTGLKRNEVSEDARKESEKIERLQIEVQKMEYMLLKLEDEKKAKEKGRLPRNRTSIILRDFVYNGRKNSGKKRKSRLYGCFRSSSSNREQNRST